MDLTMRLGKSSALPVELPESVPVDVISYSISNCPLGRLLVARSAKGVCGIFIGDQSAEMEANLAVSFPKATLIARCIAVEEDLAEVLRFLEKPEGGLRLTLDMRGTPFQKRVWEKLRAVSVGRTVTYMELARRISPLASPRMVASACAANLIALAIPCHRVVSGSSDVSGYRWGVERKRALIKMEAVARSRIRGAASEPGAKTSDAFVSPAR